MAAQLGDLGVLAVTLFWIGVNRQDAMVAKFDFYWMVNGV